MARLVNGLNQSLDGYVDHQEFRPNPALIRRVEQDFKGVIRRLKARLVGEIDFAGPGLAGSLADLGLMDEYRRYIHPVVLGRGKPFFCGPGRRSAFLPAI